jgi:serine/threonine-protein kinase
VAVDSRDQEADIWTWDFARPTLTRLTFDPSVDSYPAWMPDGRRLVFSSLREKIDAPYSQAADGIGTAERLVTDRWELDQASVSPDGKRLVLRARSTETGEDIVMLSLDGARRVESLLRTKFRERNAEISPDGRWLAYQSDESGSYEVYVRPFPQVESGRWQVSSSGGTRPLWNRNGRELLYVSADSMLMSVPVQLLGTTFGYGSATRVVDLSEYNIGTEGRGFDISPDGRRFLVTRNDEAEPGGRAEINVVLNWTEELKRLVPSN